MEWRLIKPDAEQPVEPHIPYRVRIYAGLDVQRVLLHRLELRHHVSVWSASLHQFKPTSCAGAFLLADQEILLYLLFTSSFLE